MPHRHRVVPCSPRPSTATPSPNLQLSTSTQPIYILPQHAFIVVPVSKAREIEKGFSTCDGGGGGQMVGVARPPSDAAYWVDGVDHVRLLDRHILARTLARVPAPSKRKKGRGAKRVNLHIVRLQDDATHFALIRLVYCQVCQVCLPDLDGTVPCPRGQHMWLAQMPLQRQQRPAVAHNLQHQITTTIADHQSTSPQPSGPHDRGLALCRRPKPASPSCRPLPVCKPALRTYPEQG